MKKIILSLVLAIVSLTAFSQTIISKVTLNVPVIQVTKDKVTMDKPGNYQLIFSDTAGIIYFNDLTLNSSMRIRIGKYINSEGLTVDCNSNPTDATALSYDAVVNNEYDVTFVIVLLEGGDNLYAAAINLGNYTLSMRVDKSMIVHN